MLKVKNLPANAGDLRSVSFLPGLGRPPGGGHGNPLQFSCLENAMHRGAWPATVHRVTIFIAEWIYQTSHSQSVAELGLRTNGSDLNPMFLPALFIHSQREHSHQERHRQGRKHWHWRTHGSCPGLQQDVVLARAQLTLTAQECLLWVRGHGVIQKLSLIAQSQGWPQKRNSYRCWWETAQKLPVTALLSQHAEPLIW